MLKQSSTLLPIAITPPLRPSKVLLFADRVEVWNPGELPSPLTPERLRHPHSSIARNHRICEALFLTRYIEKFGTGILMMIRESLANGLPEPQFEQRAGEFVTSIWRDWLTDKVLAELQLNDRQRHAITLLKTAGRLSNADYQKLTNAIKKTASRDLEDLRRKGVVQKIGKTGRGTYYVLSGHGDIKGQRRHPNPEKERGHKGDKGDKGDMPWNDPLSFNPST